MPGQNGRHFSDDHLKCIFLNENIWILINISLKFVPKGRSNNIPALVLIMAWRRLGYKPLSEPVLVGLLTHICVTWPQWVKDFSYWPEIWWDNAQCHEAPCWANFCKFQIRSEGWHCRSNFLRISDIGLKFGGMMHSTGWWSRLLFEMATLRRCSHFLISAGPSLNILFKLIWYSAWNNFLWKANNFSYFIFNSLVADILVTKRNQGISNQGIDLFCQIVLSHFSIAAVLNRWRAIRHPSVGWVGGFSKVVATFSHVDGSLNLFWPPPGISEWSHLFEFGVMYCMLSTFMCRHELWPTSASHPFSFLNSFWLYARLKNVHIMPWKCPSVHLYFRLWHDAQSLMLYRRGALLFFNVIHQISRSQDRKTLI